LTVLNYRLKTGQEQQAVLI